MSTAKIVFTVLGTLLIIFAAYFVTYYIASKGSRRLTGGRAVRLHDNFALSRDKSICIVELAGRVYFLAMSSGAITVIDTLDADEYEIARRKIIQETPPTISVGAVKNGFSAVQNSFVIKKLSSLAKRDTRLESPGSGIEGRNGKSAPITAEEDDLDAVYRKIQMRRAEQGKGSPQAPD